MSGFQELPDIIRDGLSRAAEAPRREGPLGPSPKSVPIEAAENGATLFLAVDPKDHTVIEARHSKAKDPVERAVLDCFCHEIEGLPLQEACDHGSLRTLHRLASPVAARPAPGIVTPRTVHPAFATPERLIDKARDAYLRSRSLDGIDAVYKPRPSDAWMGKSRDARLAAVSKSVQAFLSDRDLPASAVEADHIDDDAFHRPVRVFVAFGDAIPSEQKPILSRELEAWLKTEVEDRLELYNLTEADANKIRVIGGATRGGAKEVA